MKPLIFLFTLLLALNALAAPLVFKDEYVLYQTKPLTRSSIDCACHKLDSSGRVLLVKTGSQLRSASTNETRTLKVYDPTRDKCPVVERAFSCSPNFFLKPVITPNDPYYQAGKLWGLNGTNGIRADKAWPLATGSGRLVAVLDTGIDLTHEDLKDNLWINPGEQLDGTDTDGNGCIDDVHGCNFTGTEAPRDRNGHGTHCAGIIGASTNGFGVIGVAQKTPLIAVKTIGDSGGGSTYDAIRGINYVTDLAKAGHNIVAINASWGSYGYSEPLKQAIKEAGEQGILFVAAAGNNGVNNDTSPHYPSAYRLSNILSVGAIDKQGNMASFSNYGASSVHIYAPGVGIWSTYRQGQYHPLSGTSMAAPYVSGVAALLGGGVKDRRDKILAGVTKRSALTSRCTSGGTLDAFNAVSGTVPLCQKKGCIACNTSCKNKYKKQRKRRKCRSKCRTNSNCLKGDCK